MSRRVWRVSRHDGSWQVRRDGATRATRISSEKQAAVAAAKRVARSNAPSRVVIHRADGSVEDQTDYGAAAGLSYAGVFDGPEDLGTRSEKHLAEHFAGADPES